MNTTRTAEVTALMLRNLKADLEARVNAYNAHPTKAGERSVQAIRREIAEVAHGIG